MDITAPPWWPAGQITLMIMVFPVDFEVEIPARGTETIRVENMTPEHSVQDAWAQLRIDHPEVFAEAVFNHRGKVHPGLTMEAGILRKAVIVTVTFQILNKRVITYPSQQIWNIWSQEEVLDHFFTHDKRILPIECYETKEARQYQDHTRIDYILKSRDVVDTRGNNRGVDG
jgi:hypothetical protein